MKKTILFLSLFLLLFSFDSAFTLQQEPSEDIEWALAQAVGGVLSISPCALRPKWSDIYQGGSFAAGPGEAYIAYSPVGPAQMFAPVNLPEGAVIKKVVGLCSDNDSSAPAYVQMRLERRNNYSTTTQTLAEVSTDGLASSTSKRIRKTSVIAYPIVNNTYTYSLQVYFGPNGSTGLIFYGFWIVYE